MPIFYVQIILFRYRLCWHNDLPDTYILRPWTMVKAQIPGCTYQIIMGALVKTYMFHGSPTRQLKPDILHFTSTTVNAP